jgi:HD-GYP domain-containing protein (c-di-GMP phosphodiesterase class II)
MTSTQTKPRGLVPISMATLLPSAMLGIDVFVRAAPGLPPTTLFESHQPVDHDRLKQYADAGVKSVFIYADDQTKYQDYLNRYWDSILNDHATPVPNRLRIMGEVVRGVANKEFHANDTRHIIAETAILAQTAVQLISANEIALDQLCDVLHHDYGTFTHSTNVSLYSILLAKKLGYSLDDQQEIAVGAMLHDLGKLEIDTNILNKPGKLNLQELKVIQRHPTLAFKRLVDREDVTFGQLMMAYQHHERLDGKGYPCGVPGDQIHTYAKICAVVDVYEAITSERPYRLPMEKDAAVRIITEGIGTQFDPEIAEAWMELVGEGSTCNV